MNKKNKIPAMLFKNRIPAMLKKLIKTVLIIIITSTCVLSVDIGSRLESDKWKERKSAVESIPLSEIEDVAKVNLIRKVLNDEKAEVRLAAVKALTEIGGEVVIPPLTESLKDNKEYIRALALSGLINIGEVAADSVGSALDDPSKNIRKSALDAISIMDIRIALRYLDVALKDSEKEIRAASIERLYGVAKKSTETVVIVIRLLGKSIMDAERELRLKSIQYITEFGGREAVEVLARGLDSNDVKTRMAVVESLGSLGGDQVVQPLAKALSDSNFNIRKETLKMLNKIPTHSALKVIASANNDTDYKIRDRVVRILAVRGDKTVIGELAHMLSDRNWDIRLKAVYVLGEIGSDDAVDKICLALKDRNRAVQSAAIKVLGILKSPLSVDPLGELLVKDRYFRKDIADVLGEISHRRALKYLLKVLPDEKEEVKVSIEKAVGKIIKKKRITTEAQKNKRTETLKNEF